MVRLPDKRGHFGPFGGKFVPETLMYALEELEREGRVVFRYSDESGNITEEANVNGSLHNIAGIINRGGNVLGLMPHPERASELLLGSEDGRVIFESMIETLKSRI